MKTFVHYDSEGTIQGFVAFEAPAGVTLMLQPEAGQMVAEVDAPELASAVGDVDKFREITKLYKIKPASVPCKLTKAG